MSEPKFKVGDKVRILDGSKIANYRDGWARISMGKEVGKTATIKCVLGANSRFGVGYRLVENVWNWDERGLELVREQPRKILIMQDKADPMQVIARDLDSGQTAVAKCSPKDTFDFYTGAELAFTRLTWREAKPEPKPEPPKCKFKVGDKIIGNEKANRYGVTRKGWRGEVTDIIENPMPEICGCDKGRSQTFFAKGPNGVRYPLCEDAFDLDTEPEKPQYYTGKVVCVKARFPDMWTPGKVYTVKDGLAEDNRGLGRFGIISPEQMSSVTDPRNEFIEYKGGA